MAFVLVNIGSNLGNRRLNLSRAMRAIGESFGDFEMSHVVESAPWGFDSTHSFLNVGMAFHTDLSPLELLDRLQEIERRLSALPHRTPDGGYADREIDIDIVAIDRMVVCEERLKVPHPQLASRRFYLEPLQELAPGWTHPATGESPMDMLARLDSLEEEGKEGRH